MNGGVIACLCLASVASLSLSSATVSCDHSQLKPISLRADFFSIDSHRCLHKQSPHATSPAFVAVLHFLPLQNAQIDQCSGLLVFISRRWLPVLWANWADCLCSPPECARVIHLAPMAPLGASLLLPRCPRSPKPGTGASLMLLQASNLEPRLCLVAEIGGTLPRSTRHAISLSYA